AKQYKIELGEERIIIQMPKDEFKTYNQLVSRNKLENKSQDILLAMIVMPVMVETFNQILQSEGMYVDKLWYKSIVKAFKDKKMYIEKLRRGEFDCNKSSQELFNSSFGKAMNQIVDMQSSGGYEE